VANLSIGDKIPSSVTPQDRERAKNPSSTDAAQELHREAAARGDSVALSNGTAPPERPLSQRIGDGAQAADALQQLKTQLQERPDQAAAAHSGLDASRAYSLLKPPAA
jgi:hypothetical protein